MIVQGNRRLPRAESLRHHSLFIKQRQHYSPTTTQPKSAQMEHDNPHEAPDTVEIHDEKSHEGKLSILLAILKRSPVLLNVVCPRADCRRFIGVKDISAARLSLPSQLLEPVGNLEYEVLEGAPANIRYWHYLDRPDYFVRWVRFVMRR